MRRPPLDQAAIWCCVGGGGAAPALPDARATAATCLPEAGEPRRYGQTFRGQQIPTTRRSSGAPGRPPRRTGQENWVAYFDCAAGVSGDMFVGALLDAGASFETVQAQVGRLGLPGVELRATKVVRAGLAGTKFDVFDTRTGRAADEAPQGPDHGHRGLREILALLDGAGLSPDVLADARAIFLRLAEAEAKVHGVAPEEVHFHEVGAVDALADVVGAAAAFRDLGADEAWSSPVHVGSGTVRCAHGVLPVPAPATLELLKGAPAYSGDVRGELATPTGVALLRHFCAGFGPLPPLVVEAVGCGAGTRELEVPNLLRVTLGRPTAKEAAGREGSAA